MTVKGKQMAEMECVKLFVYAYLCICVRACVCGLIVL